MDRATGLLAAGSVHAVTWHETHRDAADLAARLATAGPWRGLVAISRGGLVPAAIISRLLDLRLIDTICIASYDGRRKGPVQVVKTAATGILDGGAGWLMVDDLADSGATAETARRMLPKAHFATLYAKPAGRRLVDTFVQEVPQDVWIDFPWDRDPAP
ncbi:MAG: xanthine phosphoribosyltransferase [Rhodospirillales bacterium]|nr:MAG: xanthine phosphoribosyltransferase [Rhodospirillales bacterium]